MLVWRNWQTHKTQNLAGATSCGFKSHNQHQKLKTNWFSAFFIIIRFHNQEFKFIYDDESHEHILQYILHLILIH